MEKLEKYGVGPLTKPLEHYQKKQTEKEESAKGKSSDFYSNDYKEESNDDIYLNISGLKIGDGKPPTPAIQQIIPTKSASQTSVSLPSSCKILTMFLLTTTSESSSFFAFYWESDEMKKKPHLIFIDALSSDRNRDFDVTHVT